jgi:hypothetical protein
MGMYGQAPPNMDVFRGGATASLGPPSQFERQQNPENVWTRVQLAMPMPQVLEGPRVAYALRQRVLNFSGIAAGSSRPLTLKFDTPGPIYALTGAAYVTDDSDLPAGRSSLDLFRIQFATSNNDQLTEAPVLGSAILGTGSWPAWLSRSCWLMDNGSALVVTVFPLVENLEVDIMCLHYEVRGPTNVTRS